jgi:hypothetical protein
MSIPETGVTSVKLTANIEGYVDEPSNDCDGTGKPFPLPDGEAVVTNGSDTQILTPGRAHLHAEHDERGREHESRIREELIKKES